MAPTHPDHPDLDSEEAIEDLVRSFYRQAAVDDLLGPVFEAAEVDWAAHIPRVTEFWAWQLIGGRRYDGRPLRAHERVNELVPFREEHYERWLELFTATLHDGWSGPVAEAADRRAHRMARSMRRVLAGVDDPEPTWAEEGVDPVVAADPDPDGPRRGASGGLVMPVALGRPGRRPAPGADGPAAG